jgi:hypothetical protein
MSACRTITFAAALSVAVLALSSPASAGDPLEKLIGKVGRYVELPYPMPGPTPLPYPRPTPIPCPEPTPLPMPGPAAQPRGERPQGRRSCRR